MTKRQKGAVVKEPVQVYLAEPDLGMLNLVAGHTGWTKAEVLRRGVRSIAAETLGDESPALRFLASAEKLDLAGDIDAALHHDAYLAAGEIESWAGPAPDKAHRPTRPKRRA